MGTSELCIAIINYLHAANIQNIFPNFLFTLLLGIFSQTTSVLLELILLQSKLISPGHLPSESQTLIKMKLQPIYPWPWIFQANYLHLLKNFLNFSFFKENFKFFVYLWNYFDLIHFHYFSTENYQKDLLNLMLLIIM